MRRFFICSGVLGRHRGLEWLCRAVAARPPEGILFAGGVLEGGDRFAGHADGWALSHDEGVFLEHFFTTLGKLGIFTAIIPGPADGRLEEFLRMGMHAELEYPSLHLVHATLVGQGDVAVSGIGGMIAEGDVCERGIFSRTLAEYHLRPLWTARQPRHILLLPKPPRGPLGGPEGSTLAGDLIDSYHPSLCVVAGTNERRGAERIASTLVINPGLLAEGAAAWLDWNQPAENQVEMLDLRQPDPTAVAVDTGVGD